MAAQFAQLALKGVVPVIENYDVIYEKGRDKVRKVPIRGQRASQGEQERYYQSMGNKDHYRSKSRDYSRDPAYGYKDRGSGYSDGYGRSGQYVAEENPRDLPPSQGRGRATSADRYASQRGGQGSGRQPRARGKLREHESKVFYMLIMP